MPKLTLKFQDAVVKEVPLLPEKELTIGRKAENGLVLKDATVSSHHCRIGFEAGAYFLEDLNSTNGTRINGEKIQKSQLHDQDIITIAAYTVVFSEKDDQAGDGAAKILSSGKIGFIRVTKGTSLQEQYELKNLSTYIGQSERAQIPVNSKGLFHKVPDVAAAIYRRAEGYVIVAMAPKAISLNGQPLTGQSALQDGDVIECGATTLQFSLPAA